MSSIAHDLYSLLRDLVSPESITYQTFDLVASKLKEYFVSKTNVIGERIRFHSMKEAELQQAKDFVMYLRKQAYKYNFGASTNDLVMDQFVVGVWNERTRRLLLTNSKLTLQKAIQTLQIE